MNLALRRYIFVLFVALFFTTSPIILLYNTGYRYDFVKGKIVKTGILVLEMRPSDAQIFLNNEPAKLQKDDDGFRITNLLPREYLVRIEKPGYFPWEKRLSIWSTTTTFATDIVLFPQNTPTLLLEGEIQFLDLRDDKALFLVNENQKTTPKFFLLNLKNRGIQEFPILYTDTSPFTQPTASIGLTSSKSTLVEARFSPNAENILIGIGVPVEENSARDYFVFDIKNPNLIIPLADILPNQEFEKIQWDTTSNYLLYGLPLELLSAPKAIYQINLLTKKSRGVPLSPQEPNPSTISKDFIASDDGIFVIKQYRNNVFLNTTVETVNKNGQTEILLHLPSSVYLSFLNPKNGLPHLIEHARDDIFIFSEEQSKFIAKLNGTLAKEKEKQWLFSNDFEVWTWNQEADKTTLISRYSSPIQDILWHPNAPYAIAAFKDTIQVIELDPRDTKNQYTLTTMEKITGPMVDSAGKQIFFIGKNKDEQGLYVQDIFDKN